MREAHMKELVSDYIGDLKNLFLNTGVTNLNNSKIEFGVAMKQAVDEIISANSNGKKVIFVGNGGSAAVANHKALDFWFTGKIRGLSFSDSALLTCVSNDFGYPEVFARPISMFADKGDVLVAISSSGNSENIVRAAEEAKKMGCRVYTFSGFGEDNHLRQKGDLNFYVASRHYNKVESTHLLLCDCILELITQYKDKIIEDHDISNVGKKILIAIDRDGTINHDPGFFGKEDGWREELKIYNGVADGIKKMNRFAKVAVITNQAGVSRGYFGTERVEEIHREMDSVLKTQGAVVDSWQYCPHVDKEYFIKRGLEIGNNPWVLENSPEHRKPNTGMLKKAAKDMGEKLEDFTHIYVVGDRISDIETGLNAGGKGVLVKNEKNEEQFEKVKELEIKYPDRILLAENLKSAAEIISFDCNKE